jgi:hypothetical protein
VLPAGALIENSPPLLVVVDVAVPFTVTVAPDRASPVEDRSVPLTVCCASTQTLKSNARQVEKADFSSRLFFMFSI